MKLGRRGRRRAAIMASPASAVASARETARTAFTSLPDRHRVLDGGWWPRSRDLVAELPGVMPAAGDAESAGRAFAHVLRGHGHDEASATLADTNSRS